MASSKDEECFERMEELEIRDDGNEEDGKTKTRGKEMDETLTEEITQAEEMSCLKVHLKSIATADFTDANHKPPPSYSVSSSLSPSSSRRGSNETDDAPCHWGIVAICSVVFDIDTGQKIEAVYPSSGTGLSDTNMQNIAYLSLPHTTKKFTATGDTQFCFRFRRDVRMPIDEWSSHRNGSTIHLKKMHAKQSFLYGFVSFRQRKDALASRGYYQKSIVLLTKCPLVDVYERIVHVIEPIFFEQGKESLQHLFDDIQNWKEPVSGSTMRLSLAGNVFRVTIPANLPSSFLQGSCLIQSMEELRCSPDKVKTMNENEDGKRRISLGDEPSLDDVLGTRQAYGDSSFQAIGLYSSFPGLESSLWHIWQLAITGEPILIVAQNARACSQAVLAYISMIDPIVYQGDYRPYFTLYDSDFQGIVQMHDQGDTTKLAGIVLGTTNPFFLKSLKMWANALFIPSSDDVGSWSSPVKIPTPKEACIGSSMAMGGLIASPRRSSLSSTSSSSFKTAKVFHHHIKKSKPLDALDFLEEERAMLYTRRKSLVPSDPIVLKQLVKETSLMKSGASTTIAAAGAAAEVKGNVYSKDDTSTDVAHASINNAILRLHFQQLTNTFLQPFDAYFRIWSGASSTSTLSLNPYDDPLTLLKPFVQTEFMDQLGRGQLPITFRAFGWKKLYARFLHSSHFHPWFESRRSEAVLELELVFKDMMRELNPMTLLPSSTNESTFKKECHRMRALIRKAIQRERKLPLADKSLIGIMESHLAYVSQTL